MSDRPLDTDRNLLFGVLALQADLIDADRFARACADWAARKDKPLADHLVERGWLTSEDRADVEKLVERKLKKHAGDARAGLAEVTTDPVRHSLAGLADADVLQSLAGLSTPAQGPVSLATTAHVPESRDRYTLSRLHATGGIGRVWLARDASLARDVALKELRPDRAGNLAVCGRFLKEAQITGQLEHPGIVPIYEVGHRPDDQAPFYTMRFVRGRTLGEAARAYHDRRKRGEAGPLELRELLGAFVGVCNAVAYAHSRGVLHRDLKPQNVVLGDYGEVIVLDWGLARLMDQTEADAAPLEVPAVGEVDATMQGQVLGTPAYMAPEQAEGRLDLLCRATDVYGLGAILYEVLTGRPPFTGAETAAVLRQVIHEPPPRPRSLVASAPPALEAVCLKALAKKTGARYATAKELASEVEHFLADEPVKDYREPLTVRSGRWMRRHRTLVTGACAAGLVALLGLAVVLAVQSRANAELRAANVRERERFELAQDAIKTFHTGVSEDVLLKQEQFKDLRNRLLREAAEFYGKLEKLLEGQNDARSRRALGSAYFQLGELTEKIGNQPEALKVYRKSLAVARALSTATEAGDEMRSTIAHILLSMGRVQHATADSAGALESLKEAQGLAEALVAESNAPAASQDLLAKLHLSTGIVLAETGKPEEALAAFEAARDLNRQLADAHPITQSFQAELSNSLNNIGELQRRTGKTEEALASYRKARAIHQKLVDGDPAVLSYRNELARIYHNIGNLLTETGQVKQALRSHQQALVLRQKLVVDYPAATLFQQDLATTHLSIGSSLAQTGQWERARESYDKAVAINQKLVENNQSLTGVQAELAKCHNNMGELLRRTSKPEEALASYQTALAMQQKLVKENPAVPSFRSTLVGIHENLGFLRQQTGKPEEALAAFEKARAHLQKLAKDDPTDPVFQTKLAGTYHFAGLLLSQIGKQKQALAAHEKTRDILQKLADIKPAAPDLLIELAESHSLIGVFLRKAGKPQAAQASFRRAIQNLKGISPPSALSLYDLACSHALLTGVAGDAGSGMTAAEAKTEADSAMSFLHKAVAAGYRDVAHMNTDTDLDALRKRDDFTKLLTDLAAKQKGEFP